MQNHSRPPAITRRWGRVGSLGPCWPGWSRIHLPNFQSKQTLHSRCLRTRPSEDKSARKQTAPGFPLGAKSGRPSPQKQLPAHASSLQAGALPFDQGLTCTSTAGRCLKHYAGSQCERARCTLPAAIKKTVWGSRSRVSAGQCRSSRRLRPLRYLVSPPACEASSSASPTPSWLVPYSDPASRHPSLLPAGLPVCAHTADKQRWKWSRRS